MNDSDKAMTNCPTAQAVTKIESKNLSAQMRNRLISGCLTKEVSSKIAPKTKPLKFKTIKVRETIEPAISREGKTANALCATAMKKHAAPSHNATRRSLTFERNLITFCSSKSSFYYVVFRRKGQI
jgi:hypothetical protein